MTTVAWLGLGQMGSLMARRLLDAGHDLVVWNRTPSRADPLRAVGARLAGSPADAARQAHVVILMLADPAALAEVTEGEDGVASAVAEGTTVIDMSTVGPEAVSRLRAVLPESVTLVDAPVLGSLAEAEAGKLTIFVGGSAADVARHRDVLAVLGDPMHVGPTGAGAAAKLVANSTLVGVLCLLGETLALGDGMGLPREVIWQVLARTPLAAAAQRRRPMIEADSYPPRFGLRLARKDCDLVVDAAERAGTDVRLMPAAQSWFADAAAAGLGAQDYAAVLSYILSPPAASTPFMAG